MTTYILLADRWVSLSEQKLQGEVPGLRLIYADSGKEAIRVWRRAKPQYGFINFALPDMTGIDCIKKINEFRIPSPGLLYLFNNIVTNHLALNAMTHGFAGCISTTSEIFHNRVLEILTGRSY